MALDILFKILQFVGSLAILLYGMDMLSSGIQKGAGSSLQKLLHIISGNRFTAVLTGLAVTAIIQSSSATTVMVVSFVNAQIISLTQAIGIIFGANIGTTVTAWIVSIFGFTFSISAVSIPLFGIGYVLKQLKKYKIHNFSDMFMGFGLLFCGLGFLSKSLTLSADSVAFLQKFSNLGFGGIVLGVLCGLIFTALIHSSSAMTAIILTMAYQGSISWELSAALVLGSNIGTTIDAILSALNASSNAKRAALVHVFFNIAGTFIALCLFRPFLRFVDFLVPGTPESNITNHISMLHTIFNICATLLFLPFVNQIADLVSKIIKDDKKTDDEHYKFPVIVPFSHLGVDFYLSQVQKEIAFMAGKVMDMFDQVYNAFSNKYSVSEDIKKKESYIDEMKDAITDFLNKCSRLPSSNQETRHSLSKMINTTDALEVLSDECCSLAFLVEKSSSKNVDVQFYKKLLEYFDEVREFFEYVSNMVILGINESQREDMTKIEDQIDEKKRKLKKEVREKIEDGKNVKIELNYLDIVRKIEKTGDCVYSIVQTL